MKSPRRLMAFDGGGMGAVLVLPDDPVLFNMRRLIVEQLTAQRLPSYFGIREAVEDGGFMSYGESLAAQLFPHRVRLETRSPKA